MTVIEYAEKRLDECDDARDMENLRYWAAYLDGARAQRIEESKPEGMNRKSKTFCPVCNSYHAPHQPHNRFNDKYRKKFFEENGRYPSWEDAAAHCDEERRKTFFKVLDGHGMDKKKESL